MMIFFKQAAMRSNEEGAKVLEYIQAHPGLVYTSAMCQDEELKEEIGEGGGSVWWCAECNHMCSPNRPCGCGDEDWYGFYDDMWDEHDSFQYVARTEHETRIERQLLNGSTYWQAVDYEEEKAESDREHWSWPEVAFWVKVRSATEPYVVEVY